MGAKSLSRVRLSAAPWTAARQAPVSADFARQEHQSPELTGGLFTTSSSWEDPSDAYSQFLVPQTVKNLSAMQETRLRSLGGEDPLEKGVAAHPRTPAWRVPWTEQPGGLQSMGSQRVESSGGTNTLTFITITHLQARIVPPSEAQIQNASRSPWTERKFKGSVCPGPVCSWMSPGRAT